MQTARQEQSLQVLPTPSQPRRRYSPAQCVWHRPKRESAGIAALVLTVETTLLEQTCYDKLQRDRRVGRRAGSSTGFGCRALAPSWKTSSSSSNSSTRGSTSNISFDDIETSDCLLATYASHPTQRHESPVSSVASGCLRRLSPDGSDGSSQPGATLHGSTCFDVDSRRCVCRKVLSKNRFIFLLSDACWERIHHSFIQHHVSYVDLEPTANPRYCVTCSMFISQLL